jgi:hypothetical protein
VEVVLHLPGFGSIAGLNAFDAALTESGNEQAIFLGQDFF